MENDRFKQKSDENQLKKKTISDTVKTSAFRWRPRVQALGHLHDRYWLMVQMIDYCGGGLAQLGAINEVTLRRARLVLGWVNSLCGKFSSV